MQQINLRQLRRDVRHGADGRLVFPGMTEITDGVITSGGKLAYADNGVDIQTQISAVVASVAAIDVHAHVQENVCYVDSKRVDAYTEDGSESLPYKTLKTALEAKLTNAATDFISFRVASGNYDDTVSIDKDSANQSFEIIGAGRNATFIRGAASFSSSTGTVLYFRDFLDIKIESLTICNGLYGFYPRSCRNIKMYDVEFKHLGSEGEEKYHDMSETQTNQQNYWAGSGTSNGGTCRIRSCTDVRIDNCRSSYCLRGFRIQDCAGGALTNLRGYKLLESFIYLASGSYNGDPNYGSSNFYISGCSCDTIFHTAFQVIGGRNNTFQGCSAVNCASGPFVLWHAADVRIIGCSADKTLTKTWIGIGSLGDNFGQVYKAGKQNVVNTGGYELTCLNNTFTQCGVGRSLSGNSTTFYFNDNAGVTSSRFIIDGNHSDATVALFNPDSITEVLAQYPSSSGPSQAAFDALEVEVDANTTNITSNDVDIASLMTSVTANDTDIAANVTALAGKQATLTWSTVGDNNTNPVQSKDIKSYVDANSGSSGASLSSNTFTGTQTVQPTSGAAVIELKAETGAGAILQLAANPYGGSSLWVGENIFNMTGDRIEVQATSGLRVPRFSSAPTIGTNNSRFGCVYYDTSSKALYFHDDSGWVELATV